MRTSPTPHRKFGAGLLLAVVCLPGGLLAQDTPQRPPKTWTPGEIDPASARIYVHVFKTGLGHEHAVVGLVKDGVIRLGATENAGQVTSDLNTFRADPDYARKAIGLAGQSDADTQTKVTANMLGPRVLDVEHFSTATVKIFSARLLEQPAKNGARQYLLEGELTFHGVTKKMRVTAEAQDAGPWIRLRGQASLLQSDFGITPFRAMLGALGVADRVELFGDAYLRKDEAPPPNITPR
jgi:polyisoprenoid-binding protein YceI